MDLESQVAGWLLAKAPQREGLIVSSFQSAGFSGLIKVSEPTDETHILRELGLPLVYQDG